MKTIMKGLTLVMVYFSILAFCEISVEKTTVSNPSAKAYLDDFDELVDTLTTYHPALYEFTSKEIFDAKIAMLRAQINSNTSKRELLWKLEEVISLVGCGHTNFGFFGSYKNLVSYHEYFPIQARLVQDEFVVTDPQVNTDLVEQGDIIKSINNKPIKELLQEIYAHIHGQAHIDSGKKGMLNAFQDLYIPFALGFPERYIIEIEGKKGLIELKPINQKPTYPPMVSPQSPCQKDFCMNELNENTALLTLRTFSYYGDKTSIFTGFLDESFEAIAKKEYSNIIIDLRGNLGGTSQIPMHLLRYILSEPFTFFAKNDFGNLNEITPFKDNNYQGNVFVLINGDGFSSVGQLASIIKDKQRAVFVGETLGSNQFCTANQKQFQLTHTGFNYSIARNIFETNVAEQNHEATIQPDYYVEQRIEDFLADKDIVLQRALELTEAK